MCATQNLLKNETLQPHLKNNWPLLSEKTTEGKRNYDFFPGSKFVKKQHTCNISFLMLEPGAHH